jgi:cysteinyl-tRNA synthetase
MPLFLYNSLSRQKEEFIPLNPPFAGMYVCGPTLYSDAHIGNCRTYISFDVISRYLRFLGFQVRYVRNITDVGHLEDENAGEGEDRVARQARLKKLEPMEVVQRYTYGFHEVMALLNAVPPDIEPLASGHIAEQIEMIRQILDRGFAYEKDGTVWFNVEKFAKEFNYGILSGRSLEDQLSNTRELEGQEEKRGRLDFALWKKARPQHIMKWDSPWGEGFPGWHIECSAMSRKYLGEKFDIHGGGMDLVPTHHTNEIAQSVGCCGTDPVKYWVHTNMLTLNGQKMSRSLGNVFLPVELFTGKKLADDSPSANPSQAKFAGKHPLFEKGYSPMAVRFFMLQSHYRSTLDFSNEALQASEKGFDKLMDAYKTIDLIIPATASSESIGNLRNACAEAMNDDFNTPVLISHLFEAVRIVNSANDGKTRLTVDDIHALKKLYEDFAFTILGLRTEEGNEKLNAVLGKVVEIVLNLRAKAKSEKNFALSDEIRKKLTDAGVMVKDSKDGVSWKI